MPASSPVRYSPGRALIWVYIPVLLVVPDTFHAITPGLPDPSANVAVMIPIFFAALAIHGRNWRLAVTDLLVLSIALTMGWSEYRAAGYSEAQNLIFGTLFQIIAPYAVARLAIDREGLHVALAKRMVIILFVVAVVGLFAIGVVGTIYVIGPQDMKVSYAATNPANLTILATPFDRCLVNHIEELPGVNQAEGARTFSTRLESEPG